jgi:hypothetical protein
MPKIFGRQWRPEISRLALHHRSLCNNLLIFHCNISVQERASRSRLQVHCLSYFRYLPAQDHEQTAHSAKERMIHRGLVPKSVGMLLLPGRRSNVCICVIPLQ